MVSKWYLFVFKVSNLRETAEGTMDLHYLALEKIPHFDEITYYSIVKTPTSTQHNPKTTSTVVGTLLWLWRVFMAVQTNPILDNHLRWSKTTILDYFRLSWTILDNYPRLSKTISGHFPKLYLVTIWDHVRQLI